MAVFEEHFLGFDPSQGASQFAGCPRLPYGAVKVWYERWIDTGWDFLNQHNTGISYSHCYGTFDALGNLLSLAPICGGQCCGFTGNLTEQLPRFPRKTPEQWLAQARAACEKYALPPPGTIEICEGFERYIGTRRALAIG